MLDSFNVRDELSVGGRRYRIYSLKKLSAQFSGVKRLPFSIKVLLENVLRNEDGERVTAEDVKKIASYDPSKPVSTEIPYMPSRVLLQDFTGVPAVVDLAAMRSAVKRLGGDPSVINPQVPVDLVIDHSLSIEYFGSPDAMDRNVEVEFKRNAERYKFLKWGASAFDRFRVFPPGSGICHQVNLEFISEVVRREVEADGAEVAFPDTLVGTDSHTPTVNGMGVLGWGVGGIEAEAVMLGEPSTMMLPEVVGVRLFGRLPDGATATDLVLAVTQLLRAKGVVGKFVEFFGPALSGLALPDRATLANMAPEYGATAGFFPVDAETIRYMRSTGRPSELIDLVEAYCREQGLFREDDSSDPVFTDVVELDLSTIKPCVAGPKRPQDRIFISELKSKFSSMLTSPVGPSGFGLDSSAVESGSSGSLRHGSVVIASITSCTNTSNPSVMLAAGLVAKKAAERGLSVPSYVKTSLAPGSQVVTDYYRRTGLMDALERLGFHVVGYGCTTCIGNSGPLPEDVASEIKDRGLIAAAVLSGNRNFEGRVNPLTRANFLASPPLVVAYALAGRVDIDFDSEPLGRDSSGTEVYLKDIWPSLDEVVSLLSEASDPSSYERVYSGITEGSSAWRAIEAGNDPLYAWDERNTYIQEPPFFEGLTKDVKPISSIDRARVLVMVGDSVTTDHISPAGPIPPDSPAAEYLRSLGVRDEDFNTYGSRRGNDRVMTRGTFGNIRLKNRLAPGTEGGWTTHFPTGEVVSIYEASQRYKGEGVSTIVLAGRDYGMGSSRDWAAKGTYLLGVRAVIAQSFERIHRSNLVGMGVLPLQFRDGDSVESLGLTGREVYSIRIDDSLSPQQEVSVLVRSDDGSEREIKVLCRLDNAVEVDTYRHGGILQKVIRKLV